MTNPLISLLGIDIPVFKAPVGSVAGAKLATAVSNAGGMGALALTWTSPSKTIALIAEIKQLTSNQFQVNFVLAFEPQSLPHAVNLNGKYRSINSLLKSPPVVVPPPTALHFG